ncbi:hypothetical protein Tco_0916011 [Tanacetum coccineum]
MSHSTLSSESVATKSIISSVASTVLPYLAPVIDYDFEPIEAPASHVISDSDSVELDNPDFEDSRAHGFVHLFELHILSFI